MSHTAAATAPVDEQEHGDLQIHRTPAGTRLTVRLYKDRFTLWTVVASFGVLFAISIYFTIAEFDVIWLAFSGFFALGTALFVAFSLRPRKQIGERVISLHADRVVMWSGEFSLAGVKCAEMFHETREHMSRYGVPEPYRVYGIKMIYDNGSERTLTEAGAAGFDDYELERIASEIQRSVEAYRGG